MKRNARQSGMKCEQFFFQLDVDSMPFLLPVGLRIAATRRRTEKRLRDFTPLTMMNGLMRFSPPAPHDVGFASPLAAGWNKVSNY